MPVRSYTTAPVVLLVVVLAGFAAPPSAAEANMGGERPTLRGIEAAPGAHAKIRFTKSQIKAARAAAKAERKTRREPARNRKHREEFLDDASAQGLALTSDDVDVIELSEDVTVTSSATVEIESVSIELNGEALTVESESSSDGKNSVVAGGPGMAPYFANNGDGQYVVTVTGWGTTTFLWRRSKLTGDGHSKYDWYMYARKAIAQPTARRLAPDARVKTLRVQSYPYDSIEPGLLNWTDLDPATSFKGNCDTSPLTVGINTPYVGVGYSFTDCDGYTVWHNPNNPGSYWIQMEQGSVVNGGSRQAGYALGFKVKQGTAGSMHDYNSTTWFLMGNQTKCGVYDSGKTCKP